MLTHSPLLLTIYFHCLLMQVSTRYWESCFSLTFLYWLVGIPLRQVQLSLSIYPASCWRVNVTRVFLHSALFPMSLNASRLQCCLCCDGTKSGIYYYWQCPDRRWSEFLSSEAGIGSDWWRIKCTVALTVRKGMSGKRMRNHWVSLVVEVQCEVNLCLTPSIKCKEFLTAHLPANRVLQRIKSGSLC